MKPKYLTKISQIRSLSEAERKSLEKVTDAFAFRANDYYLGLINWEDPEDPIRRLVVPVEEELEAWGRIDASNEESYRKVPGLEHKYPDTAVLLVNDTCGAFCRFCFRKRLFMNGNKEVSRDVSKGLEYIRAHKEISNVLLTGGDALLLSTGKLEEIIAWLREIRHVRIIRLGTKMPAFNPHRILDDPDLLEMLRRYSTARRKIYIMSHFNHPNELTDEAVEALNRLRRAGAITVNQTPMIRGVNDKVEVLKDLFCRLAAHGVAPYYVFQCRPTLGNKPYAVPVERAFDIFRRAQSQCSGLAARARFIMSHATGKVEVLAKTPENIIMRYHRSPDPRMYSRPLILRSNPRAYWLDDYADFAHKTDYHGHDLRPHSWGPLSHRREAS